MKSEVYFKIEFILFVSFNIEMIPNIIKIMFLAAPYIKCARILYSHKKKNS